MSTELEFVENDIVGEDTLDVIADADKFNSYMYSVIKPFCKGTIFEIGSGIGNISNQLINDGFSIMLSDIREGYCSRLRNRFKDNELFIGAEVVDITDPDFDNKFSSHFEQYDTVFSLNVIEHIKDEGLAIGNCKKLLKKGGTLIILVPAYQKLYNKFDKELGHYRRYTKLSLAQLFDSNELEIVHKQYFNFAGIVGWILSGSILKKNTIPEGQMRLFEFFVPIVMLIDKILLHKLGLSTIVVGEK